MTPVRVSRSGALVAAAATLAMLAATPIGVWLAGRIAAAAAGTQGWQLEVGHSGGSLLTTARLGDVTARSHELGLEAHVDEVSLAPWSDLVTVTHPAVRWDWPEGEGSAPDTVRLPLSHLPRIDLGDGDLDLRWAGGALRARGVEMRYAAVPGADPAGRLSLSVATWSVGGDRGPTGQARATLTLEPTSIAIDEVWLRCDGGDDGAVTARGHGRLDLEPSRSLTADLVFEGATPSVSSAWLDLAVAGSLAPLELTAKGEGGGTATAVGPVAALVRARVDGAAVHVESARLAVADGEASASGAYRFADGAVDAQVSARDLRLELLGVEGLGGAVAGQLRLGGTASAPEALLSLESAAISGLAPDSVDLAVDGSLTAAGALHLEARSRRLGQLAADGPVDLDSLRYDLALRGHLRADPWLGRPLAAAATGRLRPDTLDFDLRSSRLPFGDAPPGPVRAWGSLRAYRYLDADLTIGRSEVAVRLRTDLEAGRVESLAAQVRALELAQLSSALSGTVSGTARAAGPFGPAARGEARLAVDDLAVGGWSLGPVDLAAQLDGGAVRVLATAPGLHLDGRIDSTGAATLDGRLDEALLRRPAAGGGEDSLRASGVLAAGTDLGRADAGSFRVRLDRASARLGGWPLRLLGGTRVEHDGRRGELVRTLVETPVGTLRLQGRVADGVVDGRAAIDTLVAQTAAGIGARGRAELSVAGTATQPRAQLRLALDEIAFGGGSLGALTSTFDLSDSLRGALQLRPLGSTAPSLRLELTAPAAGIIGDGAPAESARAHLRVDADRLDATALATWALEDSTGLEVSLDAEVWLPASQLLVGPQWRDVLGTVRLDALTVDRGRVRFRLAAPAAARLEGGRVSIGGLEWPVEIYRRDVGAWEKAGAVRVDPREGGRDDGVLVRVVGLDLEALSLAIPGRPPLPAGRVDGRAEFAGTLEAPDLVAAIDADFEVLGRVEVHVSGNPTGWQARAVWTTMVEDSLVVTAAAPAAPLWPAWAVARGEVRSAGIDLFVLLDQVPELEALAGRLRVDVTADSLGATPRVEGQVEVEGFEIGFLGTSPRYRIPAGRLVFGPRPGGGSRGELVGFAGETSRNRGRLELTGHVDLLGLQRVEHELHLLAEGVPYRYEDTFDAPGVDADLTWRSEPTGSMLEGHVRLERPVTDVQLVELTTPPVPPPAVQNDLFESMRLNVDVDVEHLQMRSELSDMEFDGRVRTYGSFYKPRFQGEVEVTRGTVIVLNRQFTFTRGRVVLDQLVPTYSILDLIYDPALLEPDLDMEAVAKVKANDEYEEREVTLVLEGPMLSAAPRLTSPGLDNLQTLSLLAFGSTNSTNLSDYSSALYTAAGQLLLSRQVHRVGFDEFLLLPSGTSLGRVGESAIRIGKYLSRPLPLWVRYEAITREPSFGQFEVEYRITPWLLLDASAHSQYELYGLGIGVSKDF